MDHNAVLIALALACSVAVVAQSPARVSASYSPDISVPTFHYSYIPNSHWFHRPPPYPSNKSLFAQQELDGSILHQFYNVSTTNECAALTTLHGLTYFTHSSTYALCHGHNFSNVSHVDAILLGGEGSNLPRQSILSSFQLDISPPASTQLDNCKQTCQSQHGCASYRLHKSVCDLYGPTPSTRNDSVAGWITKPIHSAVKRNLPTFEPNSASRVHFYIVAHQDDAILFMSSMFHKSIEDPSTKVVFIYTTAGDAGFGDWWWKAREAGAIAASQAWVEHFGRFSAEPVLETIQVTTSNGTTHRIRSFHVGNIVNYFFSIDESGFDALNTERNPVSPMDDLAVPYSGREDLKQTLAGVMALESNGMASIEVNTQTFIHTTDADDHRLHRENGQLVRDVVNEHPKWRSCVTRRFFFDYQHWLDDVNIPSPALQVQRYAWMRLSQAIFQHKPDLIFWSNHVKNLGRTYIDRIAHATELSCL
ncbi:hypothetical protein AC1031_013553 [Aphanomyces cochlioides]|nr:hypothetical protein AC1031_013553 [Aphanomyces cochlioides]